jgi:hypothetical protein
MGGDFQTPGPFKDCNFLSELSHDSFDSALNRKVYSPEVRNITVLAPAVPR